jgi:hypothetical protein
MSSYPGNPQSLQQHQFQHQQQEQQQGMMAGVYAGGFSWAYLVGRVRSSAAGSVRHSRHSEAGSSSLLTGDVDEGGLRAIRRKRWHKKRR